MYVCSVLWIILRYSHRELKIAVVDELESAEHQNISHHNVDACRSAVMFYYNLCFERFRGFQNIEVI